MTLLDIVYKFIDCSTRCGLIKFRPEPLDGFLIRNRLVTMTPCFQWFNQLVCFSSGRFPALTGDLIQFHDHWVLVTGLVVESVHGVSTTV